MKRRLIPAALAAVLALLAPPHAAEAAKKFRSTHLAVPPQRLVALRATMASNDASALTLDGLGTPLVLQQFALVVTDVVVVPTVVTPDTTTPIFVHLTLGGRSIEVREVGARTHHLSLGGGMAATPNQPLGASNFSPVEVTVHVLGYLVDGAALASGASPEP
jgi:hypothetical protein